MAPPPTAPLALVAEDDPVTRHLVQRALRDLGCHTVLQAPDGLTAQALLRENPGIDLVVTDILMPGLDGLELLEWGREHVPDAIWIILSGVGSFGSAVEAIRLGAFDFLSKPPSVAELEVAVRNGLERRALLLERERLHVELGQMNRQLVEKVRELEEKSELLQRDLERAEVIQRALLPSAPPAVEQFCVHALYRPGQHVGGDLYDVVRIDGNHIALYVADATGHGVTAAMLSVLFKHHLALRDERTGAPLRPAAVLEAVNGAMMNALTAPGLFLTAAYVLLDTRDGVMTLASAGHPPILLIPARGETRSVNRTGPALGLSANARFREERFRLKPGDRLLLYTDGLSPAGDPPDGGRLAELLRRHPENGGKALEALLNEAQAGVEAKDRDDITLVLLDVRAGSSSVDNGMAGTGPAAPEAAPARAAVIFYGEAEDASYLALRGRATWLHCTTFLEAGLAILEARRPLVIDLSECEYLDSTCLGTVHQLVDRGGVRLRNPRPSVTELFEELGMEQVLASIHEEETPLPELHPLAATPPATDAGHRRIIEAHEALSELNPRNRETFAPVLEGLGGSSDGG
ncbi:MAG TPA: SpoIIE family protein phosphatase [Longimicrobiaceae bacterium]|nr:SpoIIE family protein phosphatase [Longimicrobiaceae bacterium]